MAPKKKDVKAEKGQQKAEQKAKLKVIEDKTFGLKNKNKSKTVQKYIKGVATAATGPVKGGEGSLVAKKVAEKEDKKQSAQQAALLASLFKGTENIKSIPVPQKGTFNPLQSRAEQKINLYADQREQKSDTMENWDMQRLEAVIAEKHGDGNDVNSTSIVCKHFLEAVEKKQYGWFWICPNGGDTCKYRHCLPPGYVLKMDEGQENDEEREELSVEELIEQQRAALPAGGTPVTLETFNEWKKRKESERYAAVVAGRDAEAKRTGAKSLHLLSGKDLFTFDPTLFVDDEGAAAEDDYQEEEDWADAIEANKASLLESAKREDEVAIQQDLFLDDGNLPDDLDELENEEPE